VFSIKKAERHESRADGGNETKPDDGRPRLSIPVQEESRRAFLAMGDQATLQPPLPLQLFLPLQPISLVVQPPLPLQLLRPLQSCLSAAGATVETPESSFLQPVVAMVPASNPAMAAEMINVLAVLDIVFSFQFCRLIHPCTPPKRLAAR
jgi:hypothetical protein